MKNIHSGERIQKVPDTPANSPDMCGRKTYPERKSCGLTNIRIRVDVPWVPEVFLAQFPVSVMSLL